mgnify:CR=1 FL=1
MIPVPILDFSQRNPDPERDVSYDDLNVYGAWSGKEWTMEKKTILSTLTETIIAGKTKDGKYAYFVYNMSEKNPDNVAIANQSIVLRVPVTRIAGDPLLEKAKAKLASRI